MVISANKGFMPVSINSSRNKVINNRLIDNNLKAISCSDMHIVMTDKTKLNFLGDKFGDNPMSLGDYFLDTGIYMTIIYGIYLLILFIKGFFI